MLSVTGSAIKMFVGNMTSAGVHADALFANHALATDTGSWNSAQYLAAAGPLVQTFDDDNQNGIADSEEGSPSNEPAASGGVADPYAVQAGKTYLKGTPETQEDYNHDGIPNGDQAMPDVLPLYVSALGLDPYWVARSYGIADALHGLTPPTDVHFLSFAGVPGVGNVTFTVLGNPLAPALPASQGTTTCTPFTTSVVTDATTSAPDYGLGVVPGVTFGDDVSRMTSSAPSSVDIIVSDGNDYDQDGLVACVEFCASDGTTNADADGDLLAGKCDPDPGTSDHTGSGLGADLDGDGWINDVDNCPIWPNTDQADRDGDGVGDVDPLAPTGSITYGSIAGCDTFVTTDTISGFPTGRGAGLPIIGAGGATQNTSALIDNDVVCSDAYTTAENLGDAVTSCTSTPDANDDGVADVSDFSSDSDGDGVSDAQEVIDGTNPLNPLDYSGYNASTSDYDHDGCSDAQELSSSTPNGGNKNPLNYWDNYDVNGDGGVDLSDTVDLLLNFGIGPDDPGAQLRDRQLPDPSHPSQLIEGDDGIDLTDAINNLAQFGISCGGIPAGTSGGGSEPAHGGYVGTP